MKKRITILVMLLMVLTMFAGCSKKEEPAAAKDQLDTIRENGKLVVGGVGIAVVCYILMNKLDPGKKWAK